MNPLRAISDWYKSVRHGRGYGVHSPWAYTVITEVLRTGRYVYYDELPAARACAAGNTTSPGTARAVYRLLVHHRPDRVTVFGPHAWDDLAHAACPAMTGKGRGDNRQSHLAGNKSKAGDLRPKEESNNSTKKEVGNRPKEESNNSTKKEVGNRPKEESNNNTKKEVGNSPKEESNNSPKGRGVIIVADPGIVTAQALARMAEPGTLLIFTCLDSTAGRRLWQATVAKVAGYALDTCGALGILNTRADLPRQYMRARL